MKKEMADKQIIATLTTAQTTTDNYVSALKFERPPDVSKILIQLIETGANDVLYQVLGSNVDTASLYVTLKTDVSLLTSTEEYETLEDVWMFIDVQIKAAVGSSQGTVTVYASGEQ